MLQYQKAYEFINELERIILSKVPSFMRKGLSPQEKQKLAELLTALLNTKENGTS